MVGNVRTKVISVIYTIGVVTSTIKSIENVCVRVWVASTSVRTAKLIFRQDPVFPVFVSTETLVTSLYAGVPEPWTYGVTRAGL